MIEFKTRAFAYNQALFAHIRLAFANFMLAGLNYFTNLDIISSKPVFYAR